MSKNITLDMLLKTVANKTKIARKSIVMNPPLKGYDWEFQRKGGKL